MLIRSIKRFWRGTVEDNYQRGRNTAGTVISGSTSKQADAAQLYRLASGTAGECAELRAFDRGIRDRLAELGYEED